MADVADPPTAPSSLTWIGQRVADRYEITRPLAKGAMGRVFLAVQHPLGREVAVKVLETSEQLDEGGEYEERFFREASTLAKLNHPNTVRVYDYGRWNDRLYLVMEYVPGNTLRAILRDAGRMEPERAIRLCRQIASSLAEAHSLGLVHRDLKPSNVLVGEQVGRRESLKVLDFGLAKESAPEHELTNVGLLLGTPRYMSPEQIRGLDLDGRSDLYALGVLLFRMLTGKVPFAQREVASLLQSQLQRPPPRFEEIAPELDLPPAVEWTCRTLLEKDPSDRFADAYELINALDGCLVVLRDDAVREASMSLEDGRVIVPFSVTDTSMSSTVQRPATVIKRVAVVGTWPWVVMGGLVVVVLVGFTVLFGMIAFGPDPNSPIPTPAQIPLQTLGTEGGASAPAAAASESEEAGEDAVDEGEAEPETETETETSAEVGLEETRNDPPPAPAPTVRTQRVPERRPTPKTTSEPKSDSKTSGETSTPTKSPLSQPKSDLKNPFKR